MSALIRRPSAHQNIALKWARERNKRGYGVTPNSVVYFIEAPEADAIKVGRTTQLDKRFSTLQMSCPFELKLLGTAPGDGEHEQRVHHLFRKEHMRGEWFRNGGHLRTFVDAVLRLPNARRQEFIEREPSVPESICRPEADIEARRYIRSLVEVMAEQVGPWKAARMYARAAGAAISKDDDYDFGDVDRDALFETEDETNATAD